MKKLDLQGLLGDPMLQVGLGILANNRGHYGAFAPAIGAGAQQGLLQAQNYAQQQQENDWRKLAQEQQTQQLDIQKQQLVIQKEKAQREASELEAQNKAISELSAKNPELAGLLAIDPKSAMKLAYPQASGADPYYTPIATENGLGNFNNRTGEFTPLNVGGKPIVKSTDSPNLQGQIAASKSYNENLYQPTDMQSGYIKNKSQLAVESGAPNPNMRVAPNVQNQRDNQRIQILQNELANEKKALFNAKTPEEKLVAQRNISLLSTELGVSNDVGIKVPTKAEEAASVQTAKDAAEFNSPENIRKREQAKQFKKTSGNVVLNAIDDIEKRISGTTAGVGGSIMRSLPINSEAYDVNSDIETVKANFGFDRLQAMRDMSPTGGALGQVAVQELTALQASVANLDPKQSPQQLKKNLQKAKTHYKNWLNTIDGDGKSQGIQQPKSNFSITAPNGKQYQFNSQNELNNFKMKAGIR